jgi:hypothetical protein
VLYKAQKDKNPLLTFSLAFSLPLPIFLAPFLLQISSHKTHIIASIFLGFHGGRRSHRWQRRTYIDLKNFGQIRQREIKGKIHQFAQIGPM